MIYPDKVRCLFCEDIFENLNELRQMGERFWIEKPRGEDKEPGFICPDCFDNFNRLEYEEKVKALLQGAKYEWEED